MEEGWKLYQVNNQVKPTESINKCHRLNQILKAILYLVTIFFIGLAGWVLFEPYNGHHPSNGGNRPLTEDSRAIAIECDFTRTKPKCNVATGQAEMHRTKRSDEDAVLNSETCETNVNATRDGLIEFATKVVVGESSDSAIGWARQNFIQMNINIGLHMMVANATDEEWQSVMNRIDEEMLRPTQPNYGEELAAFSPLSQDNKNKLRDIVETMVRLYGQCGSILNDTIISIDNQPIITFAQLLNTRENCAIGLNATKEKTRILATMIVPGNEPHSLDAIRRVNVNTYILSIVMNMALTIPNIPIASISDDEWRSKTLKLKHDVLSTPTDSENEQNTDVDSSMQIMTEYLRDIVSYYIVEFPKCDTLLRNIGLSMTPNV